MTASWILIAALAAMPAAEPASNVFPLFPGKAPGAVSESASDVPTITIMKAAADKATGAAVVICPGGGYGFLAMDHEGTQVAEYFNKLGVHAFILKYRIVQKDRPRPLKDAPLLDAQRAIRFVRSKAESMGIDPKRVGIMGFSAGGHLASTAGTHFDEGKAEGDAIDKLSCRPDFLILAYPVVSMEDGVTHNGSRTNLLGATPTAEEIALYSNEKQVTAKTPPTFIFHTHEDKAVLPENAVRFYLALTKAKVPAELHIYEKGKHGVGLGTDPKWTGGETHFDGWPKLLTKWLAIRGVLTKPTK